nr:MAG TPA: hypothetical protein [Caudoviricetes sp.]
MCQNKKSALKTHSTAAFFITKQPYFLFTLTLY